MAVLNMNTELCYLLRSVHATNLPFVKLVEAVSNVAERVAEARVISQRHDAIRL